MHTHTKSSSISMIMKNPFRKMMHGSKMPKMDDKMMPGMDSDMSSTMVIEHGTPGHECTEGTCGPAPEYMENPTMINSTVGANLNSMANGTMRHDSSPMMESSIPQNTSMESNSMAAPMMAEPMAPSDGKPLTVIELFQSQSCSSCPPANNHLLKTVQSDDPHALLLTYEVTYWNHLSWVDTFSDTRWDQRQRDYVYVIGLRAPFTPQLIVDGGAGLPNEGWWDIKKTLMEKRKDDRRAISLKIVDSKTGTGKAVEVSGSDKAKAFIEVVWYEPHPGAVNVLRGENRGVTIDHRNVVRDLKIIGKWEGGMATLDLPVGRKGLKMAVLAQRSTGGHILGAVRV